MTNLASSPLPAWSADEPAPRTDHSAARDRILTFLGFLGLAVALFAGIWLAPLSYVPGGNSADDGIFIWFLRWVPFALSHWQNPLVTTYLDFPGGVNAMWNASVPLAGIAMWPVTSIFGPVLSYNLLVTLAVGLSAWCAFLAARRYVASLAAAILGGLLYGFSPYMVAQSQGHLHMTLGAFIPPLLLLLLDDILIRQRGSAVKMGVLLGLLGAGQFLLGEELLASEVLTATLGTVLLIALYPDQVRSHRRHAQAAVAVAGVLFLALTAVPLAFQFLGSQHVSGHVQIRNTYVTDLLAFIVPTAHQQFAPPAAVRLTEQFSGYPPEWGAYLGLPLLGLLAYTAVHYWRQPLVRIASALLVLLALLSLGPTLHIAGLSTVFPVGALALGAPLVRRIVPIRVGLYAFPATWAALAAAPVVSNILPARLTLYVFLFAALLLAVFADAMLRNSRTVLRTALVIATALIPIAPQLPFPTEALRVPTFFSSEAAQQIPQGSVALVLPYARLGSSNAMVWQAASGMRFRMPEGYAIVPGPSYSAPATLTGDLIVGIESGLAPPPLTEELRRQVLADLDAWRVQTIIIGPMSQQARAIAFFSALTGQTPKSDGGVFIWTLTAA